MIDDHHEDVPTEQSPWRDAEHLPPVIEINREWIARDAKWSVELVTLIAIFCVGCAFAIPAFI
ncbi:hypothetical protein IP81_12050 [Novosphingobium sp. AAP83]|nr:hypothetical protein IP81_12050 [Novosphingobium sp. AAP83]